MGANRVAAVSAPKRAPPPSLWAVSAPATNAITARRTGVLDLFALPSGHRAPTRVTRVPLEAGVPHAVALRPPTAPSGHAHTAVTTASGALVLDGAEVASLGRTAVAAGGHTPLVTALAYHVSAVVAAGGADNALLVVDPARRRVLHRHALAALHPVPPTRLAVANDGRSVLVCSQALTQVCLTTGDLLKRFSSSPSLPTAAIALPGPVARFATANASRHISIWDAAIVPPEGSVETGGARGANAVEMPAKRRRSGGDDQGAQANLPEKTLAAPTALLIAPSAAPVTALAADAAADGSLSFAAVLRGGPVTVWLAWRPKAAGGINKPVPASFTVRPPSPEVSLHVAAFTSGGMLSILYGNPLKPTAYTLDVREVAKRGITLPGVDENIIVGGADISSIGALEQAKLDHVEKAVRLHVSNTPAVVASNRRTNGVYSNHHMPSETDESEDDAEDGDEDEEIEDKSDDRDGTEDGAPAPYDRGDGEQVYNAVDDEPSIQDRLKDLGITPTRPVEKPSSTPILDETMHNSRVRVLLQAVQSKNMVLLDDCVTKVQKRGEIRNTINQLSSETAIGALLDVLVARVDAFPLRADSYVPWIREIVIEHAGSLLVQQQNCALVALNEMIDSRTQSMDALARLEGRLELIMGQVERLKRTTEGGVDEAADETFVEDEDDDDDDDEDESEEDERVDEAESEVGSDVAEPERMEDEDEDGSHDMVAAKLSETTDGEEEDSEEEESEVAEEAEMEVIEGETSHVVVNRKDVPVANGSMDGAGEEDSSSGEDDEDDEEEDQGDEESGDDEEDNDEEDSENGDMEVGAEARSKRISDKLRASHETNGKMSGTKAKKAKGSGGQKGKTRANGGL